MKTFILVVLLCVPLILWSYAWDGGTVGSETKTCLIMLVAFAVIYPFAKRHGDRKRSRP